MSWEALVAHHANAPGTQRGKARALAYASGRPFATCYAALRRYTPGKRVRRLPHPCARCAQIRRLLAVHTP